MTRHVSAPQQEALWWIQQRSSYPDLYNVTWRMAVGRLDEPALGRAWQAVVDRYEVLRTALVYQDGAVWQEVRESAKVDLTVLRWSPEAQDAVRPGHDLFDAVAGRLHQAPFDVGEAPLARLTLITVGEAGELVLTAHHAVADGWSMRLLVRDLAAAYHAELAQPGSAAFPEPPVPYTEYAVKARQSVSDGGWQEDLAYWVKALAGVESATLVPDRAQSRQTPGAPGAVLRHPLSPKAAEGVAALTDRGGMTPFAGYLAALYAVLGRGGAGGTFAVAVGVANRFSERDTACVGYLANVVVAAGELRAGDTLDDVVARARDGFWAGLPHQHVPFSLVHNALAVEDRSRLGAVPAVMLTYHGNLGAGVRLGERETRLKASPDTSTDNDVTLGIYEEPQATVIEAGYDTSRFDEATVTRLLADLERVLEAGVRPGVPIGSLDVRSRTTTAAAMRTAPAGEQRAPALAAEETGPAGAVREIWCRTLRLPAAEAEGDFFALGGHSLQVFELFEQVQAVAGNPVDLLDWLDTPTLGRLIQLTEQTAATEPPGAHGVLLRRGEPGGPHLHLIHPAGGADQSTYRDLANALPAGWRVTMSPDGDQETVPGLAEHHLDELRAAGMPDVLGGWSLGGLIGYVMAKRLRQSGATPPPLLLIDPPAPDGSSTEAGRELDSFFSTVLRAVDAPALVPAELRLPPEDTELGLGVLAALLVTVDSALPLDALRSRFEAIRRHWAALGEYVSDEPVHVPSVLVAAELPEAAVARWTALLGPGLVLLEVAADHYEAVKAPFAARIAEAVVTCLEGTTG
ncbi:condensation domain-containing protein [Amycolatopsis sp. PS_44_ISF1]|uniref:condensation domain-containing protein n=1 Tax=Amycolatopsis sp. PS_44_ISF1 TaxID=2974917 RepID=UPI0028DED4C1|nr:condensation domain-containing protein [Amycolatopsis sp. PS_44_ISF1]MDT8912424.1 condensation domain-containing protein [Amycolatopsis sp. PS_44_ISF1]